MKHLRTVGILAMLVVFPAISWYYLKSGFDYRKASHERLQPKEIWNDQEYDLLMNVGSLKGKTTVVFDDEVTDEFVSRFYDQYKDAYTFQMLLAKKLPRDFEENLNNIVSIDTLRTISKEIILIDTSGKIRNFYDHSRESLTHLIEDVAMTIPKRPPIEIISH